MKPEQERIRSLLVDTISLLCRNGLNFENELRVQAVVGVTVDKDACFLVHINKCFERKTGDEEKCENEEQLKESLQQIVVTSNEIQTSQNASAVMQPTRDAPPTPSQMSLKTPPAASQNVSPGHEQQDQQQVSASSLPRGDNSSKSNMQTPSKHEPSDECDKLINASQKLRKMVKSPAPVESDECDDSSAFTTDSQQQRCYSSSQPARNKLRHSSDAYKPKMKKRSRCEALFDAEDDNCADFNVGQQYMYVDSGRPRARPKVPKQQCHDALFKPQCTSSMLGYGAQDVSVFVCYE